MENKVRPELFTDDQMQQHGRVLAQSHKLTKKRSCGILRHQLLHSEKTLIKAYHILTAAAAKRSHITPAAEWLLDNFYLIEEQIRIIKRHLPKKYEIGLPQLASGALHAPYPRVYDIALQIIAHGDGRWDLESLGRFVHAYQSTTPLTLGELWALPIMLRLALVENLSRVSNQIIADFNGHSLANHWANQLIEVAMTDPKKLVLVVADMVRSNPPMVSSFVAELTRRLQNAALAMPLTWVEQKLAEEGLSIEQLVQIENTGQSTHQLTVSNSIASIRHLGEVDWHKFVETMSLVEHILGEDPSYPAMDFTTRDRYRHVIEGLARRCLRSEEEVATTAMHLAKEAATNSTISHPKELHVGFYLIDKGIQRLKQRLGMRYSFWGRLQHGCKLHPLFCYLGLIVLIVVALTSGLVFKTHDLNPFWLLLLTITLVIATSQLAVALVNWFTTLFIKPQPLPSMNFSAGVPAEYRTLVAIPTLIGSIAEVESLVEALEVRFLGNRDPHVHFALLTDFPDASQEHEPEDAALLHLAQERITTLNKHYSQGGIDIFFLLHRPRLWNPAEQVWMGYERKRGKLSALNALLRENVQQNFSLIVGRTEILSQIKYVITLDSDTQLPRGCAHKLIGAMAHPLNRPHYDPMCQRVTSGYGILQPHIAEAFPNSNPTRYVWLSGNELGIDPYTHAVSDVYQDLFHEGSFIGKGIYDVDMFQQVLMECFPENRILSHDLLEGCYLRSGVLNNASLYEKTPDNYLSDVKRRARWIRGDWQLIAWLCPHIRNKEGQRIANPLSLLSKWKLLDNLRRSLVAIALMVLFTLGWTVLPRGYFWFFVMLAMVLLPAIIISMTQLLHKPHEMLVSHHFAHILQTAHRRFNQIILYLACLPHEAWYSLTSIIRSIWRLKVSHRHLLEWVPSNHADPNLHHNLAQWLRHMWMGPVIALSFFAILLINRPEALVLATPLLLLWLISPLLARWLSQPMQRPEPKLDDNQIRFLHQMARKTWGFFDTFVSAEDNWLPPDNYQEAPVDVLCHRTSPTNIGLALLANLSAYDFGYITGHQLLERTQNTLQSMKKLERYRGHFYNWYDTRTLETLQPRYISTVDGGNLAGHLLTLRQGLLALIEEPLLRIRYLDGLEDTLDLLQTAPQNEFRQLLHQARSSFTSWPDALRSAETLCVAAEKIAQSVSDPDQMQKKLLEQCRALRNELQFFADLSSLLKPDSSLRDVTMLSAEISGPLSENHKKICQYAAERIVLIETLAEQTFELAQMDVSFLYNGVTRLMSIGFNVDNQLPDRSNYDLLSSEARLACFVAIAQGQVPQESWFALGRLQMINKQGKPVFMSWSGSMFEYLMPLLVMPTFPGTLLDQVCKTAVNRHVEYGEQRRVPWGVSESGFHSFDAQSNYLYRAFGVPELGLKRGLAEDLVVAPYATVMALMVAPEAACHNLQRLATEGTVGRFGFYEAIDFTATRLPRNVHKALVRSFMAHHQGMSLLAFSHLLHDQPMQKRFIKDPLFQATLLLLQERVPQPIATYVQATKTFAPQLAINQTEESRRVFHNPNTPVPQIQLLSNGRYHVMLTQAGAGYSRWKNIAVTRWREDTTCDHWGLFSYIRDVKTGAFWSSIYQPTLDASEKNFSATFSESHVEFHRIEEGIDTHTEIVVSPEDDIELRRLHIRNRSKQQRIIEFTSYAEVALTAQLEDQSQPAFNNLFIETELAPDRNAILLTRRPRTEEQKPIWMCHMLNVYTDKAYTISFETNRRNFLGRGRTPLMPYAMTTPGDLTNTVGTVLDPIIAIRSRIILEPRESIILDLITGVTENREQCLALVEKYHDRHLADRTFELTWTYSQVMLHQLDISETEAQLYEKLASALIYANNNYRADTQTLAKNRHGQSKLWGYSISGDLPILLLHMADAANIEMVRQLVHAQAYWRQKGLIVDLVILNEECSGYRQILQDQMMSLIRAMVPSNTEHLGGIFVRVAEQMPLEDRILLQSVARVILSDQHGSINEQLNRRRPIPPSIPVLQHTEPKTLEPVHKIPMPENLQFFNGLGGFNAEGNEYIIRLPEGVSTPAPWSNVIANPHFGTLVSESGQGYTWIENAHEFRLTPWNNDPIQDSSGEAFYLRDDETGAYWSATALPCRGRGDYQIRHGFGYSVFEHSEGGMASEMWMYVALDAPIKFIVLKLRNDSKRHRKLSATGYVEWVLGDLRSKNSMHIVTEISAHGALLAENHYNTEFSERTAFFNAISSKRGLTARTVTASRTEFLGRNRSTQNPAALKHVRLSGQVGAGLDPCAAIQLSFELAPEHTREIVFILGAGRDKNEAQQLIQDFQEPSAADRALQAVREYWDKTLGAVQVSTPDPAVNLLANGWLLYQSLSSRLWGRTGYYQSSGAFGFRDQLQDAMALVHTKPDLLRAQLVLCASRQFVEGDVQHWWHPPQGRGVRTRCSDDYLWLPFALCRYVETTGDKEILDEQVPFLHGRPLNPDEESYYDLPVIGNESGTLYQHAMLAIFHGLQFGEHGLPLMGSGDWNDGMNLVGIHGKGESVWLGFFLYTILQRFAILANHHGDTAFAERCDKERIQLQQNLELHGWDGAWYRRAYFDDGTPLGSATNIECRIDSISQSWSVLSGAGEPTRTQQAMAALKQHLVRPRDKIVALLDPPFHSAPFNPGYIKGYVPGIRENGGQYTHAAVWAILAFVELGEIECAWQIFNMINPIHHGNTSEAINIYKIEPYVTAGDVYSVAPHTGNGGWSWYTGSAAWMYSLIIESLLGLQLLNGNQLRLTPQLPHGWSGYNINYRFRETVYSITITRAKENKILLDETILDKSIIPLKNDQNPHQINFFIHSN